MPLLTHRFEGRMGDELFQALESYTEESGETKGEAFRKAMSLYLRVKRDSDNEVIIRNQSDKNNPIEIEIAGL